jgi:hypothetical protein
VGGWIQRPLFYQSIRATEDTISPQIARFRPMPEVGLEVSSIQVNHAIAMLSLNMT